MAFPTTGILDDFNRANEGPPPSASWTSTGLLTSTSGLSVSSNTCLGNGTSDGGVWADSTIGPDCEVYLTETTLSADGGQFAIYLRMFSTGTASASGYLVRFTRRDANPGVDVILLRLDSGSQTQLGATFNDTAGALANGVKIGADMIGTTLTGYINRSGSWVTENTNSGDTTYTAAGQLAVRGIVYSGAFDDFGGGTVVSAVVTRPATQAFM